MSRLPDAIWDTISIDVPKEDEPHIQKFLQGRNSLIDQEKKQRSDHLFRQSLSPLARAACNIVSQIRDEERKTIWTPEFEDQLAKESHNNVYPGMMFALAKERMEKTKLWNIIKRMPKGALLHAHMDAMVDFDFIIDKMLATPGMCMFCEHHLSTPQHLENVPLKFGYRGSREGGSDIWSSEYKNSEPVLVREAADSFPNGGRTGFIKWLKSRFTITDSESLEHHHGVDAIWKKFTSIFLSISGIIFYEPIFRAFVQRLLHLLLKDGIKWVDLRLCFQFEYYREGSEKPESTHESWFAAFDHEIERFKNSEEGKGFWGARMIWSGIRRFDTRMIIEDMDVCIRMKIMYPHLIAGYDLVGQEDGGRPLKDLMPELFWFRQQCALESLTIPFFFHAGECLGDGSDADQNLFDAILLGTRRIGHGFSLYKHPLLIKMVKERKILVESCPISNEILRLCASIMSHPLPALLAQGIACALCNDDPAILGQDTSGMTHDFWQALQGWDNLGLEGLGALAENSVRWAAFEDLDNTEWVQDIERGSVGDGFRARRLREWAVEWEQFCLWVVTEFGDNEENIQR